MRPTIVFLLLLATACGPSPLGPDVSNDPTLFGGCGDVVFFAVDDDDQVMVTFNTAGLVAAAGELGTATSTVFDLPAEGVELKLEQGSHISDATCDDVIEFPGPRVERTWNAVSGTATVRIRPNPTGPRGDLVLEDVVLASDDADDLTIARLEWLDIFVGWLAG